MIKGPRTLIVLCPQVLLRYTIRSVYGVVFQSKEEGGFEDEYVNDLFHMHP